MKDIAQILVLADQGGVFTPHLQASLRVARQQSASLHILHVVEHDYNAACVLGCEFHDKLMQETRASLEDGIASHRTSADREVRLEVCYGSPIDEIARVVQERAVDLMLCPATPESQDTLAKRLLQKLRIPLLFVQPEEAAGPMTILLATDYSATSTKALARARAHAKAAGLRKIHALNAYAIPAQRHLTGLSADALHSKMREHAQMHGEEWLAENPCDDVAIDLAYCEGEPAEALLAHARSIGANTLFIGAIGRTASPSVQLGKVAASLIQGAGCSLWAERPDDENR